VQIFPRLTGAVLALALAANLSAAAGPDGCCPPPLPLPCVPAPSQAGAPGADATTGAPQAPATDAFAQAPPTGGEGAQSAVPNMIGDLFGGRIAYTPVYAVNAANGMTSATAIPRSAPIPQGVIVGGAFGTAFNVDVYVNGVRIPAGQRLSVAQAAALNTPSLFSRIPAGGSSILPLIKIVENENAQPQDRVYAMYNYYNDVEGHLNPAPSQENVSREVIGFEKTFLNGDASIGMRLPLYEIYGDDFGNRELVGDLNIILKYAFLNNRDSGNVLSAGLVLTVPTGADFEPSGYGAPVIHDKLFQPFVSGIYQFSRDFYAQAFASVVVPTDERDVTLLDNDLGVGYFAYRDSSGDRFLTSVVPILEVHVTTPLDHRGALAEPVGVSDLVDLTFGTCFGLGRTSSLTLAVAVPIVGPRPFDIEAQVLFNCRF
jgi:hypothetical protein